jgi:methyl-galactoside transport system permease protein
MDTMAELNIKKIKSFLFQNAISVVLILLVVAIAIKNPAFLSLTCLRDILLQNSTRIIIALGAALVVLTGGCDLSAGRMVGLAAVLSASMLQAADYAQKFYPKLGQLPLIIPILIVLGAGVLVGCLNGFLVSKFSIPPFIATLATMLIVYGANSLYFDMAPNYSQPIGGLRDDFTKLGSGTIGTVPIIIIIAAVVAIIMWVVLNKTRLGKNIYALGGNEEAAKVSGISVFKTTIMLYAIAGALYALGGVLEAARTGGATSNYGNMYELDAIAACVVGGVSTTGGVGTVPGIVIGVFIFGVINYGLTFIGVSPYWQLIIKGLIIAIAVGFDRRKYLTKK